MKGHDIYSPAKRSEIMGRVCSGDTRPERQLRSLLHRDGFRFRLRPHCLPGKPDIVLRRYSTVIFVHGCFWHRHAGCKKATMPKTNAVFWESKFRANELRDRRVRQELEDQGWKVITVWECELKRDPDSVLRKLRAELGNRTSPSEKLATAVESEYLDSDQNQHPSDLPPIR